MALPVSFRWDPEFVAQVDRARGDVPRSVWVRRAVERALEAESPEPPRVRTSARARRDVKPFSKEHHGS